MLTAVDAEAPRARRAYLGLLVGVVSVSTGAIFVRYAQSEADSLTIAAYRMGIAFVVVLIPTLTYQRDELLSLTKHDLQRAATSGLFLAVHFAAWIASLELTSVAISVVLVNTAPLWVGLLTPLVTRESISLATVVGMALSVLGAVTVGYGLESGGESSHDLAGGALAAVGGVALAMYLLIGRNLQRQRSLGVYVSVCYGAATAFLGSAALVAGAQLADFSPETWGSIIGLALVSQILGHTTNNWALRYLSASMIAVALLGEPICSSLFAYLLFDETLTPVQLGGGALILIGIYLAARAEHRQ